MINEIIKIFSENGISIDNEKARELSLYYELLVDANSKFNLTSITQAEEVIIKHFLDCAMLLSFYDISEKSIVDVGTGAGFPGMVLAILNPNARVTLIESAKKKCNFLEEVKFKLNLRNVNIYDYRAEDAGRDESLRETFDYAVSRAVARINILLEYLFPLLKVGGGIICYKGAGFLEEIEEARPALCKLGGEDFSYKEFELPYDKGNRALVFAKKIMPTQDQYPRRAGMPVKRPLV